MTPKINALILSLVLAGMFFFTSGCTKRNPVSPDNFPGGNATNIPTPTATATPVSATYLIDDCENGNPPHTSLNGSWALFTDGGEGGSSRIFPDPFTVAINIGQGANHSNGFAHATGKVDLIPGKAYGYVGLVMFFKPWADPILDISAYQGVHLFVKGDGRRYKIQLKAIDITDNDYFKYSFTPASEWQELNIPFASFTRSGSGKQLSDTLTTAVGFQFQPDDSLPISIFDFYLDDLGLYQ